MTRTAATSSSSSSPAQAAVQRFVEEAGIAKWRYHALGWLTWQIGKRVLQRKAAAATTAVVPARGETTKGANDMGDRTQRMKGKANEVAGRTKANAGYETGSGKTEAKGAAQEVKGKALQAVGKTRSAVKKSTR